MDRVSLQGKFANCVWNQQNLETLDVFAGDIMASRIWKLKRLRHIYTQAFGKLVVEEQGANDKTMQNLQTLCYVDADPNLGFLLNKGSFPNLRKLGLTVEEDPSYSVDEQLKSLHCLSKLRTLKLIYYHSEGESPGPVLSLDAIAFPSSLVKITLSWFVGLDVDSKNMNALGQISNLQILKLVNGQAPAESLNCGAAGNFPQLKVFHLKDSDFKRLILEEGAMPCLRHVVIQNCYYLEDVLDRLVSLGSLRQVPKSNGLKYWETASNI